MGTIGLQSARIGIKPGSKFMKNTNLAGFLAVPLTVFALAMPAGRGGLPPRPRPARTARLPRPPAAARAAVTEECKRRAAAPAAAPASAAPAASGAPATCKDGTTTTATGRGACSGHGGVQKPSKSKPAAGATAPAVAAPRCPGCLHRSTGCLAATTAAKSRRLRSQRPRPPPATPIRPERPPSARTALIPSRSTIPGPARATAASPSG